jgi:hypothetical protein
MSHPLKSWTLALATACLALLSGCNSMRIIESQVQTSVQWPASVVPSASSVLNLYRLERLPADVNNLQAGWAEVELETTLMPTTLFGSVCAPQNSSQTHGVALCAGQGTAKFISALAPATGRTAWVWDGALACAKVFRHLRAMRKR